MARKLRFAVIGAGDFAEVCHLPGLLAHPDAEVVAIFGRRAERAAALANRFGVPEATTDLAALCTRDDVDAVTICTPNAAHREAALLAFAHGKHVLCEKPLGLGPGEAEEMARAAAASGRVHQVAFTYRYLHGVQELRRRLLAGDVGEPYLFRGHHEFWDKLRPGAAIGWRELQAPAGGGVLYDSGSHMFDLARLLLGPVAAVQATVQHLPREAVEERSGEHRVVETDDHAMAWLRFASGARGHWHVSRVTPTRDDAFVQVIGREGALEALLSRGRADRLRAVATGSREWRELPLPAEASRGGSHALVRMMASFVDACRRGSLADGDASFADGLAVQRLLAASDAASGAHSGAPWVELRPPA
ncbi:MAG TPA: Gfo/Idh/MocA family oxidoreductase [Thermoanaerobaculia bacterium]|jgi:predicted dehydrogenase|nr:Gfo/Idh/MocA family oxidoreductase [Thermoanaerobaculia bacterium]